MVYLRSEEHLRRWLDERGFELGATLEAPTMNELARAWWRSRLDPGWLPRSADESQAILAGLGLTGDFWALS
ncbi:MAG TPA: hypothetical protein VI409_07065 [Gaiellaceae bacterium]|nr:hypothetical protein [Gaiellaceae bacterium]